MSAKHYEELTDDEVDMISRENLRAAYRQLRDHHVAVTTALTIRIDRMRMVYDVALDWRRHAARPSPVSHTARLIAAIDAALLVEEKDGIR